MIIGFYFSAMGIVQSSTGTIEQPDSAITAIIAGKAWIPAAFNLVAAAVLMTYSLTERQLATLRLQAAQGGDRQAPSSPSAALMRR